MAVIPQVNMSLITVIDVQPLLWTVREHGYQSHSNLQSSGVTTMAKQQGLVILASGAFPTLTCKTL